MNEFKFGLGQSVEFVKSSESGEVIGRAEYVNSNNSYLVRYEAGDGCQREEWVSEDALQ